MYFSDLPYRYLNGTAEYLTSTSIAFQRISTLLFLFILLHSVIQRMSSRTFYLFVYLTALLAFTASADEEDEDYYADDVNEKVSKLRLEGAEYLQKVMKQLQNDRTQTQAVEVPNLDSVYTQRVYDMKQEAINYVTPVYNISGPTPVPDVDAEIVHKAPPISLTKEELLALYEAAIGKVSQLPEFQGGSQPEDEHQYAPLLSTSGVNNMQGVKPTSSGQMGNPVSGYYYYYFPITSFLKPKAKPQTAVAVSTTPAPQQLHATITMMESPNKSMEPLFMAISGFIGMALMFFFSVLFVPKFSKIRSKNAQFKDTPGEMETFAQIVLEAMAGKDCSERLACEIARVFKGIKTNNKPLRVLEIILPPNLAQQISLIRKSAGKAAKCPYIPCKMKKPKPPLHNPQKPKLPPWKKKETPHDLWMKHFEKGKWQTKKQQQPNKQPQKQMRQQQQPNKQPQRQTKQQQQQPYKQLQRQTKQQQQQKKQPQWQTKNNTWKRKPPAKET